MRRACLCMRGSRQKRDRASGCRLQEGVLLHYETRESASIFKIQGAGQHGYLATQRALQATFNLGDIIQISLRAAFQPHHASESIARQVRRISNTWLYLTFFRML